MQNQYKQHESDAKRKSFKIYKTILQILQARGYAISDQKKQMTYQEYAENQLQNSREREIFYMIEDDDDENQNQMQEESNNTDKSILVYYNPKKYYPNPEPIQQNTIQNLIFSGQNIKKFFIVAGTQQKTKVPTANIDKKAQSYIESISREKDSQFQIFRDEDLMFNVLKHDLVPEHKVLSKKAKQQLLKKYKVKESQLPKILLSDPVARFLGLTRGQVVKINRKSQTAGTYTTYRIAI